MKDNKNNIREFEEKLQRIRTFLAEVNYDAALFTRSDSFSWLSCGNYAFVNKASEAAVSSFLVTRDKTVVFSNSIEMYRIQDEELNGLPYTLVDYLWNGDDLWYEDGNDYFPTENTLNTSSAAWYVRFAGKGSATFTIFKPF